MVMKNVWRTSRRSGIVADSTPQGEYEESVNKSKALLTALEKAHRGGVQGSQNDLLLDNYDSFTTTCQYLGELGCQVEVHRNDKISVEEIIRRRPERIVISPGPCTPQEAGISVELVERLAGKFPSRCLPRPSSYWRRVRRQISAPRNFSTAKPARFITTTRTFSASFQIPL